MNSPFARSRSVPLRPGAPQLYKKYDADGSGNLESGELAQLAIDYGVPMAEDELASAFLTLDKDGDGLVAFAEFEAWWGTVT
jgi:Ca2+-binding EF-hand superfamily protein